MLFAQVSTLKGVRLVVVPAGFLAHKIIYVPRVEHGA